MKPLTVRLLILAEAHDRLEQGGGASEELYEAAEEIIRLREALRRISVTRAQRNMGYLRPWKRCKDIAKEALSYE